MTLSFSVCNPSRNLTQTIYSTETCRLVAIGKFHKICKFENYVATNDVTMTSLPKTMENCGRPRNQSNFTSFERS